MHTSWALGGHATRPRQRSARHICRPDRRITTRCSGPAPASESPGPCGQSVFRPAPATERFCVMRAGESSSKRVRQQWTTGAIAQVPLGDYHTYAWMLKKFEWAFLDARSTTAMPVAEVATRPVLFRLWVMRSAYGSGRWLKVGTAAVPEELMRPVGRFVYDMISKQFGITLDGGASRRPATADECKSLECAAVWNAQHVEDRLRDHYAGVPNKWLVSLRRHLAHA